MQSGRIGASAAYMLLSVTLSVAAVLLAEAVVRWGNRGDGRCAVPMYSIAPAQISLYIAAALDLLAISLTSVTSTLRVRWPNAISMTSPTLT